MTDVRYQPRLRASAVVEAFGSDPLPVAHAARPSAALAWPGMIVEVDVTAIVAK